MLGRATILTSSNAWKLMRVHAVAIPTIEHDCSAGVPFGRNGLEMLPCGTVCDQQPARSNAMFVRELHPGEISQKTDPPLGMS